MRQALILIAITALTGCATPDPADKPPPVEYSHARVGQVYTMRGNTDPNGPRYTVLSVNRGTVRYALWSHSWPEGMRQTGAVSAAVFRRSTDLQ